MDGLYLQSGLGWQAQHGRCMYTGTERQSPCIYDRNVIRNPLGHLELGYDVNLGRFSLAAYVRHESQIAVRDYGVNQAGIAVRVYLMKP